LKVSGGHRYLPSGAVRRGSLGQVHTPRLQSERAPFSRHASGATTELHTDCFLMYAVRREESRDSAQLGTRYTVELERARPDTEQPIVTTTCGIKLVARRLPSSTGWPRSCGETAVRSYTSQRETARSVFDTIRKTRRMGASERNSQRGYHGTRD
jgi:hypothetical protein